MEPMIYEAEIYYRTWMSDQFIAKDIDDARDKLEKYTNRDIKKTLESGQLNDTTRTLLENIMWTERLATPVDHE